MIPGLRVGADIGGTFPDLVLLDEATGAIRVGKLLTTAKDPAQGVEEGVARLLDEAGVAAEAVGRPKCSRSTTPGGRGGTP